MIIKKNPNNNRAVNAGKILVGGMIAMPFIPLNKPSKYTVRMKMEEWIRCCKE